MKKSSPPTHSTLPVYPGFYLQPVGNEKELSLLFISCRLLRNKVKLENELQSEAGDFKKQFDFRSWKNNAFIVILEWKDPTSSESCK